MIVFSSFVSNRMKPKTSRLFVRRFFKCSLKTKIPPTIFIDMDVQTDFTDQIGQLKGDRTCLEVMRSTLSRDDKAITTPKTRGKRGS